MLWTTLMVVTMGILTTVGELFGFASYQLDRTNIASALTGNFATLISVDQNVINLGNQLMFLGVIVLEIPSNVILHKIGPRQWISAQVCVFGIVACLQIFVRNKLGFLLTRTFLGLAEAGYIPGAMYTLSTWYTKEALTKRIAIFFFGMFGGTAISPLLGAALLKLDGKCGLFGWQWIFLVEGLFSVAVSIILFFFLPEQNKVPVSSNQENISESRGLRLMKGPLAHPGKKHISFRLVWKTLTDIWKWPHFIATGCVFATWSPLTTYTPSIFMELGLSRIKANAFCAIGSLLTLPVILFFCVDERQIEQKGPHRHGCHLLILRIMMHRVDKWGKLGLWTAVNALAVGYHPIHNSWIQINCKSSEERNISVARAYGRNPDIPGGRVSYILSERGVDHDWAGDFGTNFCFPTNLNILDPKQVYQSKIWQQGVERSMTNQG
ncbi:hypothetical protein N7471_006890 [Penicillium samsonianum]|uniref:uncharacterized protein n=1 Tax=Penicillium samsonianum TaxID=1882272 RepID=UPI002549054F|nr:uncharacterized protein N7471_006890 [Penicillium samsonianum]KAJ6140404.1 hypothetical protein N7471_006890 [Penicillium samsonianum]